MLMFHFWHPSEVGSLLKGGKVARLHRVYTVKTRCGGVPLQDLESGSDVVHVASGK